jgi:hypothetical protein
MRNLASAKARIRRLRTELGTSFRLVFERSSPDRATCRAHQAECAQALDALISEITDLPRPVKEYAAAKDELGRIEARLLADVPPLTVSVRPPPARPAPPPRDPAPGAAPAAPAPAPESESESERGPESETEYDHESESEPGPALPPRAEAPPSPADRARLAELQDNYDTIVVQLEVAYEEQVELMAQVAALTSENAALAARVRDLESAPGSPAPAESAGLGELRALEATQQLLKEELARTYALLDCGDRALVDAARLHAEMERLIERLGHAERDLAFFRDLRAAAGRIARGAPAAAARFEQAELLQRLAREQESSRRLAAEVRELRLAAREALPEGGHRALLQARLAQQQAQLEMHKMAAKVVALKAKLKLFEANGEAGAFEEKLAPLESAYAAAVDWGYAQQAALFTEEAKKSVLEMELGALRKASAGVDQHLRAALEEKIAQQKAAEAENQALWVAIADLHAAVIGTRPGPGDGPEAIVARLRGAIGRRHRRSP